MIRLLAIAVCAVALCCAESHADSTIFLHAGVSVSNSQDNGHANSWGISQFIEDYQIPFVVGYLTEGHQGGSKRDGLFIQAMGEYHFTPEVDTLVFAGPYINATTQSTSSTTYKDEYNVTLLGGFGMRYKLSEHWSVLAQWQHVITFANKDSDVFLLGFGLHMR
jgi:hypothetical protein